MNCTSHRKVLNIRLTVAEPPDFFNVSHDGAESCRARKGQSSLRLFNDGKVCLFHLMSCVSLFSFKNLINITNENFVPVQIVKFSGQGLVNKAVVGKIKPINMSTTIPPRSQKSVSVTRDDDSVNMFVVQFSHSSPRNFCSTTFKSTSSSPMTA